MERRYCNNTSGQTGLSKQFRPRSSNILSTSLSSGIDFFPNFKKYGNDLRCPNTKGKYNKVSEYLGQTGYVSI